MRQIILAVFFMLVMAGNALALPWTQTFAQLTMPELSFNFVEGFLISGEGFAYATPLNGYDGMGNFNNTAWNSDLPNERYVRAWGPSENFLVWDVALVNNATQGLPLVEFVWFFYNLTNTETLAEGQKGLLTFFATSRFGDSQNPWQVYSSSNQPTFALYQNFFSDTIAGFSSDHFDSFRGSAVPPIQAGTGAPVPEPKTFILFGIGLLLISVNRWRQIRRH